jgi:methionine synthase I (cobalamin-dependent)/GNAT superfamily N-acetyltransferase
MSGGRANLDAPQTVLAIHQEYAQCGCHALTTNTLTMNRIYLETHNVGVSPHDVNKAGAELAKRAAGTDRYVLGDIGSTGQLLEPYGTYKESQFYDAFSEQAEILAESGVDAFIIETMFDLREAICALRACKDNVSLPVIVSMAFASDQKGGRTVMGNSAEQCAKSLTEAGADAVGANCGDLDPAQMAVVVSLLRSATTLPILAQPNAGKPKLVGERTVFDMAPVPFAAMKAVCLHDKSTIESFLRGNVFLNIYGLGDLDDFFWPHTTWYALTDSAGVRAIALMYAGGSLPCFHALAEEDKLIYTEELLRCLIPILPRRFHAHLSLGLESVLAERYTLMPHGRHYKMALTDKSLLSNFDTSGAEDLSMSHLSEIISLFKKAYPRNYFEPRMLETKQYYGIRHSGELVSTAGVHVSSRRYRVAALGNVTTHPKYRGKGYGTTVTAQVCKSLLCDIDHIGLNVKADNTSAIGCYEKLGFEVIDSYGEFEVELESS